MDRREERGFCEKWQRKKRVKNANYLLKAMNVQSASQVISLPVGRVDYMLVMLKGQ